MENVPVWSKVVDLIQEILCCPEFVQLFSSRAFTENEVISIVEEIATGPQNVNALSEGSDERQL